MSHPSVSVAPLDKRVNKVVLSNCHFFLGFFQVKCYWENTICCLLISLHIQQPWNSILPHQQLKYSYRFAYQLALSPSIFISTACTVDSIFVAICCHFAFSFSLDTCFKMLASVISTKYVNPMKCQNCSSLITGDYSRIVVYNDLFFGLTNKVYIASTNQMAVVLLIFLLSLLCSDSSSHGLSDRGVWGCLQPQGAEGGSSRWDGAMGWHPHGPPCAGAQPQDLGLSQRAAWVSLHLIYFRLF